MAININIKIYIKTFSEISYNIYDEVYNQINYGKAEGSCTLGVRAPRTPGQHRHRHFAFCALRARGHVRSARAVRQEAPGTTRTRGGDDDVNIRSSSWHTHQLHRGPTAAG